MTTTSKRTDEERDAAYARIEAERKERIAAAVVAIGPAWSERRQWREPIHGTCTVSCAVLGGLLEDLEQASGMHDIDLHVGGTLSRQVEDARITLAMIGDALDQSDAGLAEMVIKEYPDNVIGHYRQLAETVRKVEGLLSAYVDKRQATAVEMSDELLKAARARALDRLCPGYIGRFYRPSTVHELLLALARSEKTKVGEAPSVTKVRHGFALGRVMELARAIAEDEDGRG